MARNYALTILILCCTSLLITLTVSDNSPPPPTPPHSPPPPTPTSNPPPPPSPYLSPPQPSPSPPPPSPPPSPYTSAPVPTPISQLPSSPTASPPTQTPISAPPALPPTWTPPAPAPSPTSTPPVASPTSTPLAPSPTSTPQPPTPTSTYAPPTPTSTNTPLPPASYAPPTPTSTHAPPTPTSTNAPPTPTSTYTPPTPTSTYPQSPPTSTHAPPTPTSTYTPTTPTSTYTPTTPTSTYTPPTPTSTYPTTPTTTYAPPTPQQGDGPSVTPLKVQFYATTCPNAEDLVKEEMKLIQAEDPTYMPALVRLHFHDCFVRGCDASVLLVSKNGTAEKDAKPNLSLRGFDAIERIKKILEKECPRTVSCADILAMAAREAIFLSNGSRYDVETGRRDGNISIASEAYTNLPPATGNITTLINLYASKNLTVKDLVVLSGAHTFGVSHCYSFSDRLYNYSGTGYADPTLNSTYAQQLRQQCAPGGDNTTVVPLSPNNYFTFNLGYFKAVINKEGLFNADEALLHNNVTLAYVTAQVNANSTSQFFKDFAESMIHMGRIDVLTGTNGTIRDVCGSYID